MLHPVEKKFFFWENSEKTLRTILTYQENIAWIKSSWYYSRNIEGDTRDNVPQSKYWGGVSPLSHRNRLPCPGQWRVLKIGLISHEVCGLDVGRYKGRYGLRAGTSWTAREACLQFFREIVNAPPPANTSKHNNSISATARTQNAVPALYRQSDVSTSNHTIDVINVIFYVFYSGHVLTFFAFLHVFIVKNVVKCKVWICKNPTKNTLRGCLSNYFYWFWFVT